MSKNLIIAIIVVIVIVLGVSGYVFLGKNAQTQPQKVAVKPSSVPSPTSAGVSSLKDMFAKSASLQCTYTDDTGRKTMSYIKAGAMRSDFTGKTAQENGSVIIKDNKMYSWNGKQGMMMTFDMSQMMGGMPKTSPNPTSSQKSPSGQNPGDVVGALDKFKQYCKPGVVDDKLFVPPTDVTFTDYSQMMKQTPTGGAMTQDQMQKTYTSPSANQ